MPLPRRPAPLRTRRRARRALTRLLRRAYSAERAAALAYRGHARSTLEPEARRRIEAIEREEWEHRAQLGGFLRALGAAPCAPLELAAVAVGATLGTACHLLGRALPAWGAALIERLGGGGYERAAALARAAGLAGWVEPLLAMAAAEWAHEAWFQALLSRPSPPRRAASRSAPAG